ncbi:unnamed protein product [Urochloa humidicola]
MSGTGKKKNSAAEPVLELVAPVVRDEKRHEITRTMRATDKLQDLMDFYYDIVTTVPRGKGVFLYHGKRLDGKETPASHKMTNGDRIEFLTEMNPLMFVALTVHDCEGRRVTRTMQRSEKMQVLMDFYRSMVPAVACGKGVFLYRGTTRVEGEHTPADYRMMGRDHIEFSISGIKPINMFITLSVVETEGRRLTRTMRSSSQRLQDLMDFYFASVPIVAYGSGQFLFYGSKVEGWQTPENLDMLDGDEIEFLRSVYG